MQKNGIAFVTPVIEMFTQVGTRYKVDEVRVHTAHEEKLTQKKQVLLCEVTERIL
jgi:hypothetical protein